MIWTSIDTWIVAVGALCAVSCALLGNYLVLRRMSMMGDAISHAVLPGLAAAYLLTGERTSVVMFLGAAAVGVLTALFTQWVHAFGRVDRGAAMGVVFTTLFAIGLILLVRGADKVDLDPDCVLYGALEYTPLDTIEWFGWRVPRAGAVLLGVLALNAVAVGLFWKELKIASFDPELATTLGFPASAMHYLLMTLVAITTVASFEAIGSILVIAMLIVPGAAARLLTNRLGPMVAASVAIALASAGLGHAGAIVLPPFVGYESVSTSGMMATTVGVIFAGAVVFAPGTGLVARALHRRGLRERIAREDALGLLFRLEEAGEPAAVGTLRAVFKRVLGMRAWAAARARRSLAGRGLIEPREGTWRLTEEGRGRARDLVRAHRLWESYMVEEMGLKPDHVHRSAMALEHVTDERMRDELRRRVEAERDPHGREIPGGETPQP